MKNSLGLYIHIPFCTFMCHYCDFAKTANWDQSLVDDYMKALNAHLHIWFREYVEKRGHSIDTLFLGGGTPGILASELEGIFETLEYYKVKVHDACLEVNPENINDEKLSKWKSLGFNRISMGVQSFQEKGLKTLTRQHTPEQLHSALEKTLNVFQNVNIDLIYGWNGQSLQDWEKELSNLEKYAIQHLSLYCLTIEERTPFGRAENRGRLLSKNDIFQEQCYELARHYLKSRNWEHYECSNWSLPGRNCTHNSKYWQDQYFIGVGAGACGYVPDGEVGKRYSYTRKERLFTKTHLESADYKQLPHCEWEERNAEDWLTEYVGCGLRYKQGIDLEYILRKTGLQFQAQGLLKEALQDGRLRLEAQRLYLAQSEWFRETRWCLEVLKSFMS